MISALVSRLVLLVFGTLYPAYASYKAVKTKNVKEYVKWMMYWIVFAFFTTIETFADIFVAWLPFYYELKIVFVIWLLAPATKGASILYRKFVHPQLNKREKEIDTYLAKVTDQGYSALVTLGSRGFNYATNVVVSTAIKGQTKLADQLKKSYSLNDLDGDENMEFRPRGEDIEEEDETDNRIIEERYQREMMEQDEEGEKKIKREVIDVSDDESEKKVTKKHSTAQKEGHAAQPRTRGRKTRASTRQHLQDDDDS